jgi:hypothetical protein
MARQELFRHQAVVGVRRRGALSARLATLTRRRRCDVVATVCSGAFAPQLKYAQSTVGCDRAASRRVLTDVSAAWHAPAMLAGTLGGTVTARLDLIACSPPYVAGCEYRACEGHRIETRRPISVRPHVHGTVGGTVTGRCRSSVDPVERNLAVMDGHFGEVRMDVA